MRRQAERSPRRDTRRAGARASLLLVLSASACASGGAARPSAPAMPPLLHQSATDPDVSAIGSDRSDLPSRYPRGTWLPMRNALFSMQIEVDVRLNGRPLVATLDTGASSTVVSTLTLLRSGVRLTPEAGRTITVRDAHGDNIKAYVHRAKALRLGDYLFAHQRILVVERDVELFLIGSDVLSGVDLVLAADVGSVGVFAAGTAPVPEGAQSISLSAAGRQLRVAAQTPGPDANAAFQLIVDTGASETQIPLQVALRARLPANVRHASQTAAVGGVQERRGYFALDELRLGPEDTAVVVPRVIAPGTHFRTDARTGLLGNDVLLRYRTVIKWSEGTILFAPFPERGAQRRRGPGGQRCVDGSDRPVACIDVRVEPQASRDACVRVRVHPAFSGTTLEMAITAEDASGPHFAGGALRAFFTVGDAGVDECVSTLPQGGDGPPRLQLLWVRNEGVQWLCDPLATTCTDVSGPFASRAD